jgi:hypothetical protein
MNGNMNKSKNEKKKAIECWEEFVIVRDPLYEGHPHSFKKFKKNVKKLQSAIHELYGKNEQ